MNPSVTLLINSLRAGGAERVCVTLANELHALGWQVEVLVLNLRNAVIREGLDARVPLVDLQIKHARNSFVALANYVRTRRPKLFLVFNHQLAVLLAWVRMARLGDFALVARNISTLSEKVAFERSIWHKRVVHAAVSRFYRKVDLVIAQSEGMRRDLLDRYGFDAGKVRVIHNPLPEKFARKEEGRPFPWQERRDELLYVGRLSAIKGLELLVDACALNMQSRPGLLLRLVGEGDQKLPLQQRAASAGIGDRVIFEGFVADTRDFYARAKLCLLTSHYEGFPNVLVEALSQGTPVVSIDCASGPAEIVEPGVNGLLVARRDAMEFSAAINRALEMNWDASKVRSSAAKYSLSRVASNYAAELERASADHTRSRSA